MILCSNREDNRDPYKKEKRRDTWCAGKLSRETLMELNSTVQERASAFKPLRSERDMGSLLPFEELVNEASMVVSCKKEKVCSNDAPEDCTLPHPRALLHVTSRRKAPPKKKSLPVENNDLAQMQVKYEDLLLKFETQRTMTEIQINYLTRKLAVSGLYMANSRDDFMFDGNTDESLNESEASLVIKQLQEKITMLEIEKSSSQQSLGGVVELVTKQQICAKEKFEEIYEDLLNAREEAKVVQEQVTSVESIGLIHNNLRSLDESFTFVLLQWKLDSSTIAGRSRQSHATI